MACNPEATLRSCFVSDRQSCRQILSHPTSVIPSGERQTPNGVEGPRVCCGSHEPSLIFSLHNGTGGAPSVVRLGLNAGMLLFSVLLMLCYPTSTFAQQSRNKFDDHIQAFVRNGDFSGSVLIGKSGHVVFQKSYGMANYEWSIPNTERTKFHIASVTKTFTAAAVVMLQKQGKLKLSDPLSKYIPDYLNGDRITIEQMLAHSSGLPDYYSLSEYPTKKYQRVTLPDLIAWVKTKPLDFLPGSKNSYSNTGYGFLAYIIEQVSGKPYDQFIADEILQPTGMKDTGTLRDEALIRARADGYQPALGTPGLRNAPFYEKTTLTGGAVRLRGAAILIFASSPILTAGGHGKPKASTSTSSRAAATPASPRT